MSKLEAALVKHEGDYLKVRDAIRVGIDPLPDDTDNIAVIRALSEALVVAALGHNNLNRAKARDMIGEVVDLHLDLLTTDEALKVLEEGLREATRS
jgi:hypothetical protein